MLKLITITSSRAEYDLLFPLLNYIRESKKIKNKIIACGSHLDNRFGRTIELIKKDKFNDVLKIDTLHTNKKNSNYDTLNSFKIFFSKLSIFLNKKKVDAILLLGDRYEIYASSICAYFLDIPIVHISGGDTSLGSKDEIFRNSISLMSDLHFVKIDDHKKKLIKLGVNKKNIFVTGSLSNENYRKKFSQKFFINKPFVLVTFHSVTNNKNLDLSNVKYLLKSLKKLSDYNLLFTSSNHDAGGKKINSMIKKFTKSNKNSLFVHNLGRELYYQAMKECEFMIGNSSSGIIEVPSFKKGTINVGERQEGRLKSKSIIDCKPYKDEIIKAIEKLYSLDFKKVLEKSKNPYGEGEASKLIIEIIKDLDLTSIKKKKFYDL